MYGWTHSNVSLARHVSAYALPAAKLHVSFTGLFLPQVPIPRVKGCRCHQKHVTRRPRKPRQYYKYGTPFMTSPQLFSSTCIVRTAKAYLLIESLRFIIASITTGTAHDIPPPPGFRLGKFLVFASIFVYHTGTLVLPE